MSSIKPIDYVMESLKKKYPGKRITPEMYIGAQGLEPEDFEAELISMSPRGLQAGITKLANEARRDAAIERLADKARKKQE
jgi:hypothetical protein